MTAAIGSAARNAQQCCSDSGSDKNRDCNAFSPTAHPFPGPTRGLGTRGPHTAQQHGSSILPTAWQRLQTHPILTSLGQTMAQGGDGTF